MNELIKEMANGSKNIKTIRHEQIMKEEWKYKEPKKREEELDGLEKKWQQGTRKRDGNEINK